MPGAFIPEKPRERGKREPKRRETFALPEQKREPSLGEKVQEEGGTLREREPIRKRNKLYWH